MTKQLTGFRAFYCNRFMYAWAIFGSGSWLFLQTFNCYSTQNVEGLSITAFSILAVSSCLWFIFGLLLEPRNYVIMLSSTLGFIMALLLIIACVLYGKPIETA